MRESEKFILEKETFKNRISEAITVIKFLEGMEISEREQDLYNLKEIEPDPELLEKINPELFENLKKVLNHLEDPEIQEIIRVNEYVDSSKEEDFFGNSIGVILPSLRRIAKKGINLPQDQDFLNILGNKTKELLDFLEYQAKAKIKVA